MKLGQSLKKPPLDLPVVMGWFLNIDWKMWFNALWGFLSNRLQFVSVTNIADPSTELNALKCDGECGILVAYQRAAAVNNGVTVYIWDDDGGTENVPYLVDGAGGGMWIACGGAYNYPDAP